MATTTNFNWSTPDDTSLVKDGAAAIRTLGQSIDTSMAELKGGTTGQVLSKTSNTDMDFTWVAQDDSNAIQNAIVDAKGDLIAATAADTPARLAVGTNGQVLTADSTASTGLAWATPSSGGMTLLSTTSLSGSTVSVTGISSSYTSLLISVENAGLQTTAGVISANVNSATTNGYYTSFKSNSTTALNTQGGNIPLAYGETCDTGVAGNSFVIEIYNYTLTTSRKPLTFSGNYYASGWKAIWGGGGLERQDAVSSFQLITSAGTFNAGTLKIYGVK